VVSASAAIESWAVVGAAVVGAAVVGAAVVGAAVVIAAVVGAAVVGAAVVGAAVAGAIEDDVSTVGASGEEEEEEDDAVGTLQWQFSPSKMFLVTVYPAGVSLTNVWSLSVKLSPLTTLMRRRMGRIIAKEFILKK